MAPRGSRGIVVHDQRSAHRARVRFDADRAVAAEVTRIAPESLVLVEVLGGEDVDRERLDAVWRFTAARGFVAVALRPEAEVRPDLLHLARIVLERPTAAHALEAGIDDEL